MKVYSLHVGDTNVPYGQFCGGLSGWTGMRGIWRFATDKGHDFVVPIHAYLIDHPESGPCFIPSVPGERAGKVAYAKVR